MAEKKQTKKVEVLEREYVIPLRSEIRKVPRYRKTEKAIKAIKEFLARHMKIYDRDLSKIKLDSYLNEFVWARGIKNPPHQVKVKAVKNGDIVRVSLVDYPDKLKYKKARAEKLEKAASEVSKKKKEAKKALEEKHKEETTSEETSEDKKEEKEKKAAVVEEGQEIAKAAAKQMKHQTGGKTKEPKHQFRQTLQK